VLRAGKLRILDFRFWIFDCRKETDKSLPGDKARAFLPNPKSKSGPADANPKLYGGKMKKYIGHLSLLCQIVFLMPALLAAQTKPLREIKVGYPLGGSSSYFWVAQRSGSFERHGLKIEPIYIRGGLMGIQAALSGDLLLQLQGASTVVAAWAQGAKELQFIGAVGNRLDYILAAHPSIMRPEDLKGKRIGVSQLGSSTDFIARLAARRLNLIPDKDVQIVGTGGQGDRWTALTAGQIQATVLQSPFTLKARKAGYPVFIDFSKEDFEYTIAGPVTTRSFIRAERETVMNFMRGLADGMDFYRDEKNKDRVIKFLGEYYRSNVVEELEETRRVYSQVTPGLPIVTVKAMENVIANDKNLAGMKLNVRELLDLSFLEQLAQERKIKLR
jgi:ABC-type nitrate/sulfonate/bicarbonate transport system substrate-binding protein